MGGDNGSGRAGHEDGQPHTAPTAEGGVHPAVRLRLGVDGEVELHPGTPPAAAQLAHARLSGLPLGALLAARWGVPQTLAPPTRLRSGSPPAAACLRSAGLHEPWLHLTWPGPDAAAAPPACTTLAAPADVGADVLAWSGLSPEDALSAAGPRLRGTGVTHVELTDGLSLHQLLLDDDVPRPGTRHHLLGTPDDPCGCVTVTGPDVPAVVLEVGWMLTHVARHARLGNEVRRKDHTAQRGADLQRAVLSVVSGDAPPEAAVYAATRLLHARAGTLVTAHAGGRPVPDTYGEWLTDAVRQQVAQRLAADPDPRPDYAVTLPDGAPVLIVPLPPQGARRGAWVFQLSRRPWFLRPHVLDTLLEAARHPVHLHGPWPDAPGRAAGADPGPGAPAAPRSVLGLLQHLGDVGPPPAVAAKGLHYLAPGGGAWGAYLGVRGGPDPGGTGGVVTLSSILRTGDDGDQPRPAVVQSLVAAFWHTVGSAGGLSVSAPHPLLAPPLRRLALAPVRTGGGNRVTGVLLVGNGPEDARSDAQVTTLLAVLAQQVGQATDRQLALRQLSRSREQTFRVLGRVLEYRSYETKGHTDRVTSLALKLGLQLDLDQDQLTVLRWGAYLHDIGKIAIPDVVLHKRGPLDDHERRQMHEHVLIGEALLREQDLVPEGVLEIVRSHHERWDGSGYPDRLRGEGIPLLARVFSVVDVYDALTSARAYKPSWTRDQSLTELGVLAGRALDPHLVGVFTDMVRRGDLDTEDEPTATSSVSAD